MKPSRARPGVRVEVKKSSTLPLCDAERQGVIQEVDENRNWFPVCVALDFGARLFFAADELRRLPSPFVPWDRVKIKKSGLQGTVLYRDRQGIVLVELDISKDHIPYSEDELRRLICKDGRYGRG